MKMSAFGSRGMTLVEMLAAGVLSVIVAGAFFSVYNMYNNELKETSAYLAMQRQYENVSEQIALCVRAAHKIIPSDEAYHDTCNTLIDTVSLIWCHFDTNDIIGGYKIENDELSEWDTVCNGWIPFEAGNGTVQIDSTRSWFVLNGCKNKVELHLTLQYAGYDTIFYLPPRKDAFVCRN